MEEPSYKDVELSAKMGSVTFDRKAASCMYVHMYILTYVYIYVRKYVCGRGHVQVSWEARVIGSPGTRITGPELPIELPSRAVLAS